MMFDWNAELESARRQVAEIEEKVSRLREVLKGNTDVPTEATPIGRILDTAKRTLSVRMASLDRAKLHQRFIEQKIAAGATTESKPLPYVELAQICFSAAQSMPQGSAADLVRAQAAAFYTKSLKGRDRAS
jgi:hypothetical protein